ncbi:cyclic nucleotide-binding domain-containing protein [Candidatus Cytomitobacter indipagum]|uniref:Cyclic nucleotide-binding domain-containing protein n=1 Tax=Candidatus Cytomitobacter indipagum TaxID=2601575 RepID=A0A5C0UEP9_9PROT|nr:cyclic nucleotide-binding domain-containing protein [Candidatus Cytomitobacter indipagum]QEK38161.1 cyclic nucleotide-binding domain-containing protein [Candidatus Cytomitobacter indipagum]
MKERRINSLKNAKVLSAVQNTHAFAEFITPRLFMKMLPCVNLETGIFRINRVKKYKNNPHALNEESVKSIELMSYLNNKEISSLIGNSSKKSCILGEVIEQNQSENKFYIILSGEYELVLLNHNEKPVVIANLQAGKFFGGFKALGYENYDKIKIRTSVPGSMLVVENDSFKDLLQKDEFRYYVKSSIMNYENEYNTGEHKAKLISSYSDEPMMPKSYTEYDESPEEIELDVIQSVLGIHSRIHELYNNPHPQFESQLKILIQNILEREEWEIFNNASHGLINQVSHDRKITTRTGPATPDDMDELLGMLWKDPSVIVAHPRAISAFARECTKRGVPPVIVRMFGSNLITWRGVPLVPCDKIGITKRHDGLAITNMMAIRLGMDKQGVVGLNKPDISYGGIPSLSVREMNTDDMSVINYLITKYYNVAVLVPDALAMLCNIEIGHYHD